jgi:hypothetical protein
MIIVSFCKSYTSSSLHTFGKLFSMYCTAAVFSSVQLWSSANLNLKMIRIYALYMQRPQKINILNYTMPIVITCSTLKRYFHIYTKQLLTLSRPTY